MWTSIFVIPRSKTLTLEKPKPVPKEQRSMFRAPDLRDILRVFNVHVTLSHTTGNRNIAISADRRQVTYVYKGQGQNPCWKEVYEDYGVLGSPVITSGRHYWEVDVSKKCAWILGVYGEKHAEYNTKLPLKADGNHQNVYPRYQPKNGYWVIGLNPDSVYNAFDESASSDPVILTLSLSVPPRRIGVFLDCGAGTLLFLNVTNHGFLIYKFSSCSFSQKTFPYFNPLTCKVPMNLSVNERILRIQDRRGQVAMASGKLVNLQEKLTCPICLELLTEPFSLDCGQSFCQACNTTNNKESMIGLDGERRCPVFRIKYGPGNLWPHWHLANIVEWLREVKERNLEKQERTLEIPALLEEDDKAICWLCKWSQEYCGHHTFLMEKVAQKNQWKLQEFLKRLRREQQEAEKLRAQVKGEINTWKILNSEELKEWQNLKTEEEVGLCNLADSENELVQQSQL
ncbi:hypothetical protein Celaphus_00009152, partial [Cervus elaphus hippelaphus]